MNPWLGQTCFSSKKAVVIPSFTDLASGNAYGRPGVKNPVSGTGDGGSGGEGGDAGVGYWQEEYWTQGDVDAGKHPGTDRFGNSIVGQQKGWDFVVVKEPGPGKPGVDGADGVIVIYWDKEAEA